MVNRSTQDKLRRTARWFGKSICFVLFLIVLGSVAAVPAFQEKGGRDPITPKPTSSPRRTPTPGRTPPPPRLKPAVVAVSVSPPDSTLFVDNEQYDKGDTQTGSFTLSLRVSALKPQEHTLLVRHAGYSDKQQRVTLTSGENSAVNIVLEPLTGTLNVSPDALGTSISIESVDPYREFGRYDGFVKDLGLPPGEYEVTISKYGYQTVKRRVTIRPAQSMLLELQIPPLPSPTPTPSATPTGPTANVVPMNSSVGIEGKFLVVQIRGASGEASSTSGSINVSVTNGIMPAEVTGMLNGLPCQVEFIRLENVAEGSLIEAPGPSNQWARIIIRVRPKEKKRPIRFAINWKSLQGSSSLIPTLDTGAFLDAVLIRKVHPASQWAARYSRTSGPVNVSVVIDNQGNVVSAKAIDGPFVLRKAAEDAARRWKFRPATRDGQPVESMHTILFAFEK